MEKINFQNNTAPYINDVNLNQMQDNIEDEIELKTNMIKNNEIYSSNETQTNKKWIDGKPIYRKVINTGALPNTDTKTIPYNISNVDKICKLYGIAYNPNMNITYVLPHVNISNIIYQVALYIENQNIKISAGIDRTNFTESYIVIEYTKTTD